VLVVSVADGPSATYSTCGDSPLTKEWHVSLQKRYSLLKAMSRKPECYRI